jgi:hypothetical protein
MRKNNFSGGLKVFQNLGQLERASALFSIRQQALKMTGLGYYSHPVILSGPRSLGGEESLRLFATASPGKCRRSDPHVPRGHNSNMRIRDELATDD